jgi:hypothetical protein
MLETFRITGMGSREESIRQADEAVLAMMGRDNITLSMRRASGPGWFEETVKAGLITTDVVKDRQRGT